MITFFKLSNNVFYCFKYSYKCKIYNNFLLICLNINIYVHHF